jgi:Rrf2 family protein
MNAGKGPIFLKDIAKSEEISEKYLSQIIIPLKARGLVTTFRGAHGGYILSRPAGDIRLREIVETLEGDLGLVECVSNAGVCGRSGDCVTREVWNQMGSLLTEFLDSVTLEELVNRCRAKSGMNGSDSDYSI